MTQETKEQIDNELLEDYHNKTGPLRGDIYNCTLPKQNISTGHSCEFGIRPCVVVSSNVGNRTSDIVMVCPVTTRIKDISCNVAIKWSRWGKKSQVLCNQIVTMPKSLMNAATYLGGLSREELKRVDRAILTSLGIKYKKDLPNDTVEEVIL